MQLNLPQVFMGLLEMLQSKKIKTKKPIKWTTEINSIHLEK